ncbi:glycosyltransferase family 4 protein [Candidatus Binatia bacterium]|nr:glycosyltransferase family 4 protein [Candidatus Binatia bacterium]
MVMHVAFLNPVADIGGAEISLLELLRRLDGNPRTTVLLPEDGPLRQRLAEIGVQSRIVPWPARLMGFGERAGLSGLAGALSAVSALPLLLHRLRRTLAGLDADCLVTNGIKSHVIGAAVTKGLHTPMVWYLRDGLAGRRLSTPLLRICGGRCAAGIAISRYVAGEARQVLPPDTRIEVLYNLVDLDRFQPGIAPPVDLPRAPAEVRFGVVGAVTPLKGQDLFLAAAPSVLAAVPEARFFVVGGNFYRTEKRLKFADELRSMVAARGLGDRVRFLGQRADMPAVMSSLDVLVQPNRGPEGLGRAILEAMACGVPVVAVDRWGPAELVRHRETGLLAPWMDVAALAKSMIALGKDAPLRHRLGTNGRAWLTKHVVAGTIVPRFREVIADVAGKVSAQGCVPR